MQTLYILSPVQCHIIPCTIDDLLRELFRDIWSKIRRFLTKVYLKILKSVVMAMGIPRKWTKMSKKYIFVVSLLLLRWHFKYPTQIYIKSCKTMKPILKWYPDPELLLCISCLLTDATVEIFRVNKTNTMAADALAPLVASPSAAITVLDSLVFLFHEEDFELFVQSQCWEISSYVHQIVHIFKVPKI